MRFSLVFAGALALCWVIVSVSFVLWVTGSAEFWNRVFDIILIGSLLSLTGYFVYHPLEKP
jgi:hypothetical protein